MSKPHLRTVFVILAILGMAFGVTAQPASDSLLASYIRESWANHPDLESMRAMVAAESARTAMSSAWMNPELRGGLLNVPSDFDTHKDPMTMWEIGVSQRVPFPGKNAEAGRAGRTKIRAAMANLEAGRYSAAEAVISAYYSLAGAIALRKVLERGSALIQQTVDASTIALSTGTGPQADALRAKTELEQWKVRLLSNEADITRERAALAAAVGRHDAGTLTDPVLPDTLPPVPDLSGALMADSAKDAPEVRQAELAAVAARQDVKRAKLDYWPDIDVMLSYGIRGYLRSGGGVDPMTGQVQPTGRIAQDPMVSIELSAPIPLFYAGNQKARVDELKAMQRQRDADVQRARLDKEKELQELYAQWRENAAGGRLELSTVLPNAQAAWESALIGFRETKVSFPVLSEARMTVNEAEMESLMHRAGAWEAYYRFQAALGQLTLGGLEK